MLDLRPCCECCHVELEVSDPDVWICSFECTWCGSCARELLGMTCPNCEGELAPRPRRPAAALVANPPRGERVLARDCPGAVLQG